MSCDKFREYMSLHVDGRLDSASERALREHLAVCPRCREALTALESADKAAKAAGRREPREGYWDSFSGRVMRRIESEEDRRAESRWTKWLPVVLPPQGRRLRFAAGVASIAVAVVAGVLFVYRQGDRVAPTVLQAPTGVEKRAEKGENLVSEGQKASEEETAAPAEKKDLPRSTAKKAAPAVDADKEDAPLAAKREAPPGAPKMESAPTAASTQTAQAPKEETPAAGNEALDVAATTEPSKEERLAAPAPEKMAKPTTVSFAAADKRGSAAFERSQPVGGVTLRKIADSDTSLTIDGLRAHIAAWKTQIEASPADTLVNEGYREVAAAYCLLAEQTGKAADMEEGARVIQTYLDSSTDPATREFLAARLVDIQGLKKK
jgi:hypothetical protein